MATIPRGKTLFGKGRGSITGDPRIFWKSISENLAIHLITFFQKNIQREYYVKSSSMLHCKN